MRTTPFFDFAGMVQFYTRTAGGVGPYDDNAEVSICDDSTIGMWSKICLKKERHTCMDVWTLLPVTIKNTTMYAISAEPELYTRSDILPLKPCLLRGRLFSCPQRTRLMLGYQYLPSIRPPWKCTTLSSDETDPDVHLSCESSSKIAEASYIGDYDSFSPNRQFPDVPIMYYNRTERRVLMHLPRHVTRRVDELRSNDPRGVSFPPLAVAVASSAFAPRRLQAQQLNEL